MAEKGAEMAKMQSELKTLRRQKEIYEALHGMDEDEDVDINKSQTAKYEEAIAAAIQSRDEAVHQLAKMEESNIALKETISALRKEIAFLKQERNQKSTIPTQKSLRSSAAKRYLGTSPARISRKNSTAKRSRAGSSERSKSCKHTNGRTVSRTLSSRTSGRSDASNRASSLSADSDGVSDRRSKTPSKIKKNRHKTGKAPDWNAIHKKHVFSHHVDLVDDVKNRNDRIAKIFSNFDSVDSVVPEEEENVFENATERVTVSVTDKVTDNATEKVREITKHKAHGPVIEDKAVGPKAGGPDKKPSLKRKRKFKEIAQSNDPPTTKSEELPVPQLKRAKISGNSAASKSEKVVKKEGKVGKSTNGTQGKKQNVRRRGKKVFWKCTNCGSTT